jgi:DNA-binding winged helix-turn-helix (wHTH) protein/tetratricopeptide (TPR) repeat protein
MPEQPCLGFGPFRLDLRDERLWRGAEVIHLHPKTLAVLRALVAQGGQLVTKEALLAAVWPATVVSESVLTVAIRELRRALGDQARRPQFIKTVHGRGYRFIAPVTEAAPVPERSQTGGMVRLPQTGTPVHSMFFVGREAELARLHQWWAQASQGRRQVGMIAGEPGIGKTALVDTFVGQASAMEALWVGHGQCVESYGAGEPYLPVLEALGRLGRGPEGSRLVSVLRQYAPSWLVQLPALLPPDAWEALQHTVGSAAQPRMRRELTDALDVLTTERPLVLVFEDLHWSDRATLDWLAYVARRPDPARLLILGTYRPVEAIAYAHPLRAILTELRQHGQCGEVTLDYLSEAEVSAYLRQRFGDTRLAAELARVLHQRTNGNPLFLSAVVDELVRRQVVTGGPEGWEVRAEVDTLTGIIPAHLRALIELQLAHCSPEDQTLLAAASVAGVEFTAAAVAAGLERADEEIEARCMVLAQQGQLLQARGQMEWPDGTVTAGYGFRHALYQEVVYQQIPASRQSRWHARMGTRLAQGFGEEAGDMAGAVAMHFVRGRLLAQAVPYLRQAGEKALARSAYREAAGYFEQALRVLPQLPETRGTREQAIDLRLALRSALNPSGDFGRGLAYLREAESLAVALDDPRRLGQVSLYLSVHFYFLGVYDQAIATAQRALALATASGDAVLHALANQYLGTTYQAQGDYCRAIDYLGQTVASLEGSWRHKRLGRVFMPAVLSRARLPWSHAELGSFAEGKALGEEGLRIAEAVDHSASVMIASWGLGLLALRQGDLPRALPLLERAVGLCQDADLPLYFPWMAWALGAAYTLNGRVADAVPLLTQALEQADAMGRVDVQACCSLSLGEAQMRAGRLEEAYTLAEQTLAHARKHKERGNEAYALRLLGELAAHRAPPDAEGADRYYREALALGEELGMRPLQAHCHLGLGSLYAETGQREQARAELSAASEMYRSLAMTLWLPQVEAALVQMEDEQRRVCSKPSRGSCRLP